MLDEFRALGGVAENIRLGEGALGRGLFAVDPALPVRLHIPANLVVDTDKVVFTNGRLTAAPDASLGERERRFFDAYQAQFSWGSGGREEIERVFEAAGALPETLRGALLGEYRCGAWFEPHSQALVERQFVDSRRIDYGKRIVLMPVLELANHGRGATFEIGDGIMIQGRVADELLVRYSDMDSYGVFQSWGFTVEQPQAMSIALSGSVGQTTIRIDREFGDFKSGGRVWVPELSRTVDGIKLNYLVNGNRQYPRLCKGIFYKLMREQGLQGYEEAFDVIQHVNHMHFLGLMAALDGVQGTMADMLRRMARLQLQTMSFSFGVREM